MADIEFRTGVIRPVECFKEGWELIKSDYWMLFAISLVGGIIGGASVYILLGAMICGIYYCYLQKIDGKPVSFDGLWKGFSYFMPSLLVTILIVVPMLAIFALTYFPIIMAAVMGSKLSPDEFMQLMMGTLAVDFIIAIVMVCFHTLLIFAFPLIVDRNLSGWQAVKTSAKAVWKNMGGVVGLIGVNFVLVLLGELLCFVGVYLVIPVMIAGNLVAYRKIFPSTQNPNQPPPPNAYQGAGSYT
ncbi:MAG: hypothetical protein WA584_14110 [Pyrinomonadaceae bacterium]